MPTLLGRKLFRPVIVPSNYTTKINAAFYGMEYGIQLLTHLSTTLFFFLPLNLLIYYVWGQQKGAS
jgi:nicotinamide riboside transporter PnuC